MYKQEKSNYHLFKPSVAKPALTLGGSLPNRHRHSILSALTCINLLLPALPHLLCVPSLRDYHSASEPQVSHCCVLLFLSDLTPTGPSHEFNSAFIKTTGHVLNVFISNNYETQYYLSLFVTISWTVNIKIGSVKSTFAPIQKLIIYPLLFNHLSIRLLLAIHTAPLSKSNNGLSLNMFTYLFF